MLTAIFIVGIACFPVVVLWPAFGAYLLLFTTPLVVGFARGAIPLRPNEVLLLVVVAALGVRMILLMLARQYRPPRLDRMDLAMLLLVATGSVMPFLWRLIRSLPLDSGDWLYSFVLVKYFCLFWVFRSVTRTPEEVSRCLQVALVSSAIEAIIGLLQVLGLFGVPQFLLNNYDSVYNSAEIGFRASSTIGTTFGHADLMIMSLIAALAWSRTPGANQELLRAAALLFLVGCITSGEFSAYVGLFVAVIGFATLYGGGFRRLLPAIMLISPVILVTFLTVLINRFGSSDTGPVVYANSWMGRWDNLTTYFLPKLLSDFNWLLGVQPAPRVPAPEAWRKFVYIESGYIWLLWIGGLPFLLAFGNFIATALGNLRPIARNRLDAVGAAAAAGYCYVLALAVLMLFDPHLTLRGTADFMFPLTAMSLLRQPGRVLQRSPLQPVVTDWRLRASYRHP